MKTEPNPFEFLLYVVPPFIGIVLTASYVTNKILYCLILTPLTLWYLFVSLVFLLPGDDSLLGLMDSPQLSREEKRKFRINTFTISSLCILLSISVVSNKFFLTLTLVPLITLFFQSGKRVLPQIRTERRLFKFVKKHAPGLLQDKKKLSNTLKEAERNREKIASVLANLNRAPETDQDYVAYGQLINRIKDEAIPELDKRIEDLYVAFVKKDMAESISFEGMVEDITSSSNKLTEGIIASYDGIRKENELLA